VGGVFGWGGGGRTADLSAALRDDKKWVVLDDKKCMVLDDKKWVLRDDKKMGAAR
jgi:hypothetical protein